MKGNVIDISTGISGDMPVYDGDPIPLIEKITSIKENGYVLSRISMGTHTGTHIDAPSHILEDGKTVDRIPPESLMGKAVLLDMSAGSGNITAAELEDLWQEFSGEQDVDVLLIKTLNSLSLPDALLNSRRMLTADAGRWILKSGFGVVGSDLLSVDCERSLPNHYLFLRNNINIVEYLHLSEVIPGVYYFICLPLKLINCDGAPARAILISPGSAINRIF